MSEEGETLLAYSQELLRWIGIELETFVNGQVSDLTADETSRFGHEMKRIDVNIVHQAQGLLFWLRRATTLKSEIRGTGESEREAS